MIDSQSLHFSVHHVHLDPRSLLGLTTLVAAFLNSSKRGFYAVTGLRGPRVLTVTSMVPDKEEWWQHALDLLIQPLR